MKKQSTKRKKESDAALWAAAAQDVAAAMNYAYLQTSGIGIPDMVRHVELFLPQAKALYKIRMLSGIKEPGTTPEGLRRGALSYVLADYMAREHGADIEITYEAIGYALDSWGKHRASQH